MINIGYELVGGELYGFIIYLNCENELVVFFCYNVNVNGNLVL